MHVLVLVAAVLVAVTVMVVLVPVLVTQITPRPASLLLRKAFSDSPAKPPAPWPEGSDRVRVMHDIPYPSKYAEHMLDLYLPPEGDHVTTTVIWVHGGAFVGGDKGDARYYARSLAAHGYAVVSMNYALAPESCYPSPLIQVGDVCRWVNQSGQVYGINQTRLVLAGDSAGAHIAAQFAAAQTSKDYAAGIGATDIDSVSIDAVLLYCGPYDLIRPQADENRVSRWFFAQAAWAYFGTRRWRRQFSHQVTLREHITSSFPATFITDGCDGSFARDGKDLATVLSRRHVPVTSFFPGCRTGHEYQFLQDTVAGVECYKRTVDFLRSCGL